METNWRELLERLIVGLEKLTWEEGSDGFVKSKHYELTCVCECHYPGETFGEIIPRYRRHEHTPDCPWRQAKEALNAPPADAPENTARTVRLDGINPQVVRDSPFPVGLSLRLNGKQAFAAANAIQGYARPICWHFPDAKPTPVTIEAISRLGDFNADFRDDGADATCADATCLLMLAPPLVVAPTAN